MMPNRQSRSIAVFVLLITTLLTRIQRITAALPEVSSTLLSSHRLYLQQPPHDTALYDCLGVSPNATVALITQKYRKLSRRLHPDKTKGNADDGDNGATAAAAAKQLQQVRRAYDILKDDASRLPYHRYGLQDIDQAAWMLMGSSEMFQGLENGNDSLELLRLMGYQPHDDKRNSQSQSDNYKRRVQFIAANLVEKIRPLVEGVISEATMAHVVIGECDRLKKLPLGAQIVRCIGRAYRYSGQRVLRQYQQNGINKSTAVRLEVSSSVRETLRRAKHVWNAAVATGRVVLSEQLQAPPKHQQEGSISIEQPASIGYYFGQMGETPADCLEQQQQQQQHDDAPTDQELRQHERRKAQTAMLESLQVEALWKIHKIELDHTVREACALILEGHYSFFPSHQQADQGNGGGGGGSGEDGWIGSSGIAIDAETGRIRAASALVLIGNIMVQRSKEGTAWME
jgi:curved DNA-binding protein CbpA